MIKSPQQKTIAEVYAAIAKEISDLTPTSAKSLPVVPSGTNAWYEASYPVFLQNFPRNHAPNAEQFCRLIGYAYSWVGTIPKRNPLDQVDRVADAVEVVYRCEEAEPNDLGKTRSARHSLIECVQRAVLKNGNSDKIVIASKILHFWNGDLAPMIDVNVGKAWGKLSADSRASCDLKTLSASPSASQYLSYWEVAFRIRQYAGISYRNLDLHLFNAGKSRG